MAIQNEVHNAELAYLLFPFEQYSNLNGKPLVGGHIEVFEAGTSNKYITYQDWDGDSNPFKIPIPEDGRIVALADPSLTYDVYCYDSFNNLVCSRLNVQCSVPGTINLSGADTRIKNTDGTLDISLLTQANNVREYTINTRNKELGVESPLYFARNDESATIIGFSGDDYLTEDKFEYDNNNNITAYNHSAFASNGQTYSAGTNIDITDNVISVIGLPTSSDIENAISSAVTNVENKFEYNENNYITAYNNSAFAGTNYSAGDYVSIENDTISVTGLQPSGDYTTKTELVSATSGKIDVTGMTAYQPVGDYYSASNPSGFITEDALTGLQPSGDYATRDDLTAYATTALVSSISSELYSAFSGISGDFELVAGSGISIVDYPLEHKTVISVSGDYATNADIASSTSSLLPKSAVNGIFNSVFANTVNYSQKPTANAIHASQNDLLNVGQIVGSANSNFYIVPSGVLQIPNVITANTAGLTASGLSAHTAYGLTANGLTADAYNSGFSAIGISAGKQGPFIIQGAHEFISSTNGVGFTFSSDNTNFNTAALTTAQSNNLVGMPAPKFEARNISGAGFSIEASGAKGYDESGNVVWDTFNPQVKNIISYADTKTAAGGLNGNIILTTQPSTNASNLTSSPYVIMDAAQASYFAAYGPSAQTPTVKLIPGTITVGYEAGNAKTTVGYNDVKQELSGSSWTLTGSIQKRELEYDVNTSAITAIAGSAIGCGGGEVPEGAKIVNHDNTLSGNGTVDSPLGVVHGYNETVLFESTGASANINLSEPLSGFERIEMRYYPQELTKSYTVIEYFPGAATNFGLAKWVYHGGNVNSPYVLYCTRYILSGNSLTFNKADHTWFNTSFVKAGNGNNPLMISKIIGINRKAH